MNSAKVPQTEPHYHKCDVCEETSPDLQWYNMTSMMTCGKTKCLSEMDTRYKKHGSDLALRDMQELLRANQQKISSALGVPARYLGMPN